jgi:hypothetical protein
MNTWWVSLLAIQCAGMGRLLWNWAVTVAPSLWPVVTLLIGIYVGGRIASRNQPKYWILENKRAEYRRLLSVLTSSASKIIVFEEARSAGFSGRDMQKIQEVARRSANIIYSRLFIAEEVRKLDVLSRWTNSTGAFRKSHDAKIFVKEFGRLIDDIKKEALKNFSER